MVVDVAQFLFANALAEAWMILQCAVRIILSKREVLAGLYRMMTQIVDHETC